MKERTGQPQRRPPRKPGIVAALCLAAVLPAFFVTTGRMDAVGILPEFYAFGHVLWFAALAAVCARALRARTGAPLAALVVLGALTLIGAVIELVQPGFGRSASLEDLLANLAGSLLGLVVVLGGRRRPLLLPGALALALLALADPVAGLADRAVGRTQFPLISGFETPFETRRWSLGRRTAEIALEGRHSMRIEFRADAPPNFALGRPGGDWSGHDVLALAVHASAATTLHLSIGDERHRLAGAPWGDRYDGRFPLTPGWNRLRIPLDSIRHGPQTRPLDLDRIERFILFVSQPGPPPVLHLDAVRLEQAPTRGAVGRTRPGTGAGAASFASGTSGHVIRGAAD